MSRIRSGRLVATHTIDELKAALPRRVTVVFTRCVETGPPDIPSGVTVACEPQRWVVDVTGPLGELVSRLAHLPVQDIDVAPFALEDAVLRLYGERPSC